MSRALRFLSALAAAAVAISNGDAAPQATIVRNVNVVPMDEERVVSGVSLVLEQGRIAVLSRGEPPSTPPGATVVDGRGGFLIPGLWDMHVHLAGESDAAMLLAHGVTGARDMFGSPERLALRERIRSGDTPGPDLVVAGPIIEGEPPPEHASVIATEGRRMVASFEDGVEAVREQHEAGYDFIKVYNNVPAEAYRGIVTEASRRGLPVAGHVPFEVGLEGAFEHRQASIEHLRGYVWELVPEDAPQQPGADLRSRTLAWSYAEPERMAELAARSRREGVWNTPTLTVGLIFQSADAIESYLRGPEARFLSESWTSTLRDRKRITWLSNFSDADFLDAERGRRVQRRLVRALADAGARLLAGTDRSPWGLSLHTELRELVESGLTPYQALHAATRAPAQFLGRRDGSGIVAVGSPANLVLLRANPLEDVTSSLEIEGVFRRGIWLDRASLDALIEPR